MIIQALAISPWWHTATLGKEFHLCIKSIKKNSYGLMIKAAVTLLHKLTSSTNIIAFLSKEKRNLCQWNAFLHLFFRTIRLEKQSTSTMSELSAVDTFDNKKKSELYEIRPAIDHKKNLRQLMILGAEKKMLLKCTDRKYVSLEQKHRIIKDEI
ncbi:hypothetical protein BDC45DRAFT_557013 [Circinella umbellata]|nr:hypothetical protein BDC45DRAFT_557013 [Circinella umbellata]